MDRPPVVPSKVLIVRPSALGDVCRTVPVAAALRRAYPNTEIDWIVQDSFVEAVVAHPAVRRVIPFPRRRFAAWWKPRVARELLGWLSALRRERYDLVLDCQGLARSGIFARWSGAPERIGYSQAAEGSWLALTRRVDAPLELHAVDRMMKLAIAAGTDDTAAMQLYVPPGAPDRIASALGDRADLLQDGYAVVAPTSRWPGKLWPSDRYAAAIERLNMPVVLVGAEHERAQCAPLLELSRRRRHVVDLIGSTSIGSLMALVSRASLVIGSDSACIHMAVGFDRPLVALYGPTDASRVGPYKRERSVVQRLEPGDQFDHKDEPRGRAMMERITVDDVVQKAAEELARKR